MFILIIGIMQKVMCNTHTHTHRFNGPLSGTTQVSRHQKGKTNLDFTEARDSEWQWRQLGHMQTICTLCQTDNHTNTSSLNFYRPDALPDTQPIAVTGGGDWGLHILPLVPRTDFSGFVQIRREVGGVKRL